MSFIRSMAKSTRSVDMLQSHQAGFQSKEMVALRPESFAIYKAFSRNEIRLLRC